MGRLANTSTNRTDVHKSLRHSGTRLIQIYLNNFVFLKSVLCFFTLSQDTRVKKSSKFGMETPGISNSFLKRKSSFHLCCTKITQIPEAPVITVTQTVLVKDYESTIVKFWEITKRAGGTQK